MFEAIAFYTFSILTIIMFGIVVFTKNALYAMSALAGGMIFISGFFFLLGAEFLGVVQIIVYSGAIMAIYAFGMMFFDTTRDVKENIHSKKVLYALSIISAVLIVIILSAPIYSANIESLYPVGISQNYSENPGNVQDVGIVLFIKYLVPFELAAIMLLVAMISGIVLVSKRMEMNLTEEDNHEEKGEII
ncbi:NADH-quinone oxidoreductase subunit J [Sulfurospirillum arcachonense]|uniref:NADH-quinone oxidoreductase subunit J n=1 Tax=Sulfurospirillum arcachonense TaxID=57666 RepID=UPI0004697440|nr:NADH-quinone oxidoreductase subunit J [Sulfurospirillum arcachonense]